MSRSWWRASCAHLITGSPVQTLHNIHERRVNLFADVTGMRKLILMLYVPLVIVSAGRWKPNYSTENKALCKAYCVKIYFDCYQKYKCNQPEMKYRINFCKDEYSKCYPKCLDELHVLDMSPNPERMSPETKEIFNRLNRELSGTKP